MKNNHFRNTAFLWFVSLGLNSNIYAQQPTELHASGQTALQWLSTPAAFIGYTLSIIAATLVVAYFIFRKQNKKKEPEHEATPIQVETIEKKEEPAQSIEVIQADIAKYLRGPLSVISTSLTEIMNDASVSTVLQQRTKLAYRNATYMQNAFEQMLDISVQNTISEELNISEYTPSDIIESGINHFKDIVNSSEINLQYEANHQNTYKIWIDFKRMDFIFKNILCNIFRNIQYSGNIKISINQEKENGQYNCVYRISYNKDVQFNVPENFHELGIRQIKDIIEKHHGKIEIIQNELECKEYIISIPMGREHFKKDKQVKFVEPIEHYATNIPFTAHTQEKQETEPSTNTDNEKQQEKHKLLIIEDHKDISIYLKILFSEEYNVYLAEDGEEGIKTAYSILPDIIISDVMMPKMDGFEVARRLKEDINTCHIPIILLTALTSDEDVMKGMDLGADDYVMKPFKTEVLKSKVKRLIKNRIDLKRAYTQLIGETGQTKVETITHETEDKGEQSNEDPLVTKTLQLISENIQNEDFSVKKLAEMLNMSQPTLYRRIKLLTNFTLIEIIRGVRLKKAAELLKTTDYNVQEVSEAVGYNDVPTFRKHFVEMYGVTPSVYSKEESTPAK